MTGNLYRRTAALALAVLLSAMALSTPSCQVGQPIPGDTRLVGTRLDGRPSPDFRLTDQAGDSIALSDLRGRVVVLTFLYTSCPDTCPTITTKLDRVHELLGERAAEVAFVVVTVDPERDDVARIKQFLDAQGLADTLVFLTGDRGALENVWAAYHIAVTPPRESPDRDRRVVAYAIAHTDVLYLIDRAGRQRALMPADFATGDLLANVQALIDGGP